MCNVVWHIVALNQYDDNDDDDDDDGGGGGGGGGDGDDSSDIRLQLQFIGVWVHEIMPLCRYSPAGWPRETFEKWH